MLDIKELEKIIEILGTHTEHEDHGYCDTGEDMEYKCRRRVACGCYVTARRICAMIA